MVPVDKVAEMSVQEREGQLLLKVSHRRSESKLSWKIHRVRTARLCKIVENAMARYLEVLLLSKGIGRRGVLLHGRMWVSYRQESFGHLQV